jgi:hypothetical protein
MHPPLKSIQSSKLNNFLVDGFLIPQSIPAIPKFTYSLYFQMQFKDDHGCPSLELLSYHIHNMSTPRMESIIDPYRGISRKYIDPVLFEPSGN